MQDCRNTRLFALLAVLPLFFVAAGWPQFRGPAGSGVSDAVDLPDTWSNEQGVVWKSKLPGYGGSSPIVLGDRAYLTSYSGYGLNEDEPGEETSLVRHIVCIDLSTGKIVWDRSIRPEGSIHNYQGFQALHGYASSTPTTDGESLFYFFGTSGVGAVSLDGKPLWNTNVGTKTHNWGTGTSPVLYRNLVIVNASVESDSLVALDKTTGEEVWRVEGIKRTWSTPLLVKVADGTSELVVSMQNRLSAFNPASGEELWTCDSFKDYICPSPIGHDGIVYTIGSRKSSALAVEAGGRGDVTKTHRKWLIRKGSNVPSPVYHDGYLFWVHEQRGSAYCVHAESGKIIYEKRLSPRPGRIYASPFVADGKIYIVSRTKGVYVLAARPEFKLIAHNEPLDDSTFNGSPAIAGNRLLIRSDQWLYLIDK